MVSKVGNGKGTKGCTDSHVFGKTFLMARLDTTLSGSVNLETLPRNDIHVKSTAELETLSVSRPVHAAPEPFPHMAFCCVPW